ncbi:MULTISPECIES: hypothetical protein [Paenibacillus]|uniref:hypothetical protein n=1 Tax=Paenibacillus TaxID=44249 RepID=UPI002FE29EB3
MAKMDWKNSDVVKAEDMNQIGQEINQLHTELKDRLDTADIDPVTLQPGLQVINAAKDARFRLGEIKGRTLINVLGNSGSCDSLQGWPDTGRFTIDTTNKVEGSASIKGNLLTGDPYVDLNQIIRYQPSKFYVAVGEVKVPSGVQARIRMIESERPETERASEVILSSTGDKFKTLFFKVPQNAFSESGTVYFGAVIVGSQGSTGNVDALRIYEISASEYDSLNGMTAEQIAIKYPFVPSGIIGVDSPYVVRYGENLLPPFPEWPEKGGNVAIDGPYDVTINAAGTTQEYLQYNLDVLPGQSYTITGANVRAVDLNSVTILAFTGNTVSSKTFTIPSNCKKLSIIVSNATQAPTGTGNVGTSPGVYRTTEPMLNLGITPKPFKPRRDTMLALQTELNSNPIDGSNPDVLFEKEGQYFKLAKWKKVVLDGLLPWEYHTAESGYKVVRISGGRISGFTDSSPNNKFVTKYNGARLPWISEIGDEGAFWNDLNFNGGSFLVAVLNKDSGWGELSKTETFSGDGAKKAFTLTPPNGLALMPSTFFVSVNGSPTTAYTYTSHVLTFTTAPAAGTNNIVITYRSAYIPTSDEIKAYFNGWVMASQETWNTTFEQYNGSGTKGWLKRYVGIGTPVTSSQIGVFERGSGDYGYTLPSTVINSLWTPYQLLYRLAKDSVEPVSSEGALSLHEGNNLTEVGTGIVLREKANPNFIDTYKINDAGASISWLRYATNRILSIYKDSQNDYGWETASNSSYGRGGAIAVLAKGLFDPSVVYSVTYIKLDRSPVQPISGSVAATEKAQLVDLTADVAEALQRVSVVEQKKAEKDVPLVWITPTLLNGWNNMVSEPLLFTKVGRRVQLTGRVTGGLTSNGVVLFRLPAGYRTLRTTTIPILYSAASNSGIGELVLGSDGSVMLYGLGGNEYVDCSNITFLAEY